ncbi:MAG: arginine--tRNA ligase [Rhodospirillales bacterium]
MNLYQHFRDEVIRLLAELAAAGGIPAGLDASRVSVDPAREAAHGDITTNAAMVLAKPAGMNPRALAGILAERLGGLAAVSAADIAGPGFINMRLAAGFWHQRLKEVLLAGPAYGDSDVGGGEAINVEYVSANPTGPLHVAHGRGAVVGDALATLLEKAGFKVTREYYINDAGAQVEMLAETSAMRAQEALGIISVDDETLKGRYPGEYLKPVGQELAKAYGKERFNTSDPDNIEFLVSFSTDEMMKLIRSDLKALGIHFDVFVSERELVECGDVDEVLKELDNKGLIYTGVLEAPKGYAPDDWEPRPQTLFRSSAFGDEIDRPLKKSDGSWTYFAADMAYHRNKFRRGFKTMIDVWGTDHGGYVKRMKAAVKAISDGEATLDVKICQLVHLSRGGKPVRMSKRAGDYETLRDLIADVGRDVVRFMMLTRKNDSQMEFDLEKALDQSRDNPVFYVHYAHARCRSVLRSAAADFGAGSVTAEALAKADLGLLKDDAELAVIKIMAGWPRLVETAAEAHEPHRVAYYLNELATAFHALWNLGNDNARLKFIIDDKALTLARLALVQGVATVIASGLLVMGVTPREELR